MMLTTKELQEATNQIQYPGYRAGKEAIADYYNQISSLETQWKEWLAEEYADHLSSAAQDLLYIKAWQDGHSAGYQEVEGHYVNLALFIQAIQNA